MREGESESESEGERDRERERESEREDEYGISVNASVYHGICLKVETQTTTYLIFNYFIKKIVSSILSLSTD